MILGKRNLNMNSPIPRDEDDGACKICTSHCHKEEYQLRLRKGELFMNSEQRYWYEYCTSNSWRIHIYWGRLWGGLEIFGACPIPTCSAGPLCLTFISTFVPLNREGRLS